MVKLDVSSLRYLAKDDFRVLTAVEMGMRNHELVPRALVYSISGIQNGSVSKILMNLTQNKLLSYERGKRYDGYRLTYMGYDYLALNVLRNRGVVDSVGHQIGVGKESDVYVAASNDNNDDEGKKFAIKFHRLGRTCFRKVSEKRDYQRKNQNHKNASWIYLSRLAAMREFAFMKLLYEQKLFPVPEPIDMNRHCIVMELIDGVILNNISAEDFKENPEAIKILYDKLMAIIIKLTNEFGVVHGDFNEFNILIKLDGTFDPVLIDFPQMISVNHELAEKYFERDVNCIVDFFAKRFHFESDTIPVFEPPVPSTQENQNNDLRNLADALEDEEEIMKYSEQRKKQETKEKCQDACPFKDGKSELLSRFLDSLPNDDEAAAALIFNNNKSDEEPNNSEYANLPDLINNVNLSEGRTERNNNEADDNLPSVNVEEDSLNNSTNVIPTRIFNEAFDQSSHNSDVYSTATTFSVMEIKNRLLREHRKQEIKQRMRINPKKTIKGDANAMRRKKKDDQKLANEDLKSFRNDGHGFW